jgi:hypothetical protein
MIVILSIVMLSHIRLCAIMQTVVKMSVSMVNVVAPKGLILQKYNIVSYLSHEKKSAILIKTETK